MQFSLTQRRLRVCEVFRKKRSLQIIFQARSSYLWLVAFWLLFYCHWSSVFWPSVIGWAVAMSHQWVILLSFTKLYYCPCYRPQSYVIVHVIAHRAMLSSMLSSTELCYRPCYLPQSYVIFHRATLSSMLSHWDNAELPHLFVTLLAV